MLNQHQTLVTLLTTLPGLNLTGSRYFGNANDASDWDFFIEDTEEVKAVLTELGFKNKRKDSYSSDQFITSVMSMYNIDVQLVSDVEVKCKAQELLRDNRVLGFDKTANTRMWNLAMTCAKEFLRDSSNNG